MNKTMWVFILVFAFIFYLIYLNRAHAKIQEAIIVAIASLIAVIVGVIFFSSEPQEIKQDISTVYFISLDHKQPIFFTSPVLMDYAFPSGVIWSDFRTKKPEMEKQILKEFPNDFNPLIDLQVAAILQHLSMFYSQEWDMQRISKTLPFSRSFAGRSLSQNPKDKKIFVKKDLIDIFLGNILVDSLSNDAKISFPKATKLKYIPENGEYRVCKIRISKWFAFDTEITIFFTRYSAGLGKIGAYAGLVVPTNKWYVNWEERDKFGTVVINMSCRAKFSKLRSGDPQVLKYKTWIRNLFDDLYETFDWEACDQAMRQYYEELANLSTVSHLGSGFEQQPKGGVEKKEETKGSGSDNKSEKNTK